MLSIIISSVDKQALKKAKANIASTVNIPHEILAYENSFGKRGLCQIYNQGAYEAQYPYLCYMHEDINIITTNWGEKVVRFFQDSKIGIIGIAGSTYKSLSISGCMSIGGNTERLNLIQHFKYINREPIHLYNNPEKENLAKVSCIDGVWFCTKKELVLNHPFDEERFKGFHSYDVDFSLSIGKNYTIGVTYDILIEHFSEGNFDRNWMIEAINLHKKWNSQLPRYSKKYSKEHFLLTEKNTFKYFFLKSIILNLSNKFIYTSLKPSKSLFRLNFCLYLKLFFFIVKNIKMPW